MEIQDLTSIISSGLIVPVIGSGFCKVKVPVNRVDPHNKFAGNVTVLKDAMEKNADVTLTLNEYLALRMADKFGLNYLDDSMLNLNCVFLKSKFTEATRYKMLHDEYQQLSTEKLLDDYEKLASIRDFRIYINTGPDNFLADAFARIPDRKPQFIAAQLLESNNNNVVIKEPSAFEPIVFNIFGSIVKAPYNDCAVTDENYIEMIVKLQQESTTQQSAFNTLFNLLRENNLLIIGSSFPDWLMRFLIRLIAAERYTQSNQKLISDAGTLSRIEFENFLQQYQGQVITQNEETFKSPGDFVQALYNATQNSSQNIVQRYKEKVFISFISEDKNIAQLLNNAFAEKGVPVFFDGNEIFSGTNFNNVIKPEIQNCDFFLPVITARSVKDPIDVKRYVYKEWTLAGFRRMAGEDAAATTTFIKPYTIGTDAINMSVYETYFDGIGMEKIPDTSREALIAFVESFITRNNLTPVNN